MATNCFVDTGKRQACPECGNNHRFKAVSCQVSEDCCECYIECLECGFDPTAEDTGNRVEDVWGDVSQEAVPFIFSTCWLELLSETQTPAQKAP